MPDYRYVDFHIFIDCDLEQVIALTVTNATIQYRLLILKVFVAPLLMFLQYFFTFPCHSLPLVNRQSPNLSILWCCSPISSFAFFSFLILSLLPGNHHKKTCLYSLTHLTPTHFYIVKLGFKGVYIIFLISVQTINCGYSLEPPLRGGSNESPQFMFWEEI